MTLPLSSFWDQQTLLPAATAYSLSVGGKVVLFDEVAQQIFQQNDSAAAIWAVLCEERTMARAASALARADDEYEAVLGYVREAVGQWLRMGLFLPDLERAEPRHRIGLQWVGRGLTLNLFGGMDADMVRSIFREFVGGQLPMQTLNIREIAGLVFISDDQGRTCARAPDEWIPEVKARVTAALLSGIEPGFLVHAALLSRNGEGVLVCGAPGAGKSTLSLSLLAAGFSYHADDVVWMKDDGEALGAPFAPALKAGTWPLLEEMNVSIDTSPAYRRADGQTVRYLLANARHEPVRIGAILLLSRQESGEPRIEPVEPIAVLTAILESAYSGRGALSPSSLRRLAMCVESARVGRLRFSDWRDGVRLVDGFVP